MCHLAQHNTSFHLWKRCSFVSEINFPFAAKWIVLQIESWYQVTFIVCPHVANNKQSRKLFQVTQNPPFLTEQCLSSIFSPFFKMLMSIPFRITSSSSDIFDHLRGWTLTVRSQSYNTKEKRYLTECQHCRHNLNFYHLVGIFSKPKFHWKWGFNAYTAVFIRRKYLTSYVETYIIRAWKWLSIISRCIV